MNALTSQTGLPSESVPFKNLSLFSSTKFKAAGIEKYSPLEKFYSKAERISGPRASSIASKSNKPSGLIKPALIKS